MGMNKATKYISSGIAALGVLALSAAPVLAQKIDLKPTGDFSPLGDLTVPKLVSGFVKLTLVAAAVIFFFILVIGGIRWIMSGGDKQATESARGQITAALVGLVIVFAAFAIVQLIQTLFGIRILELEIPKF